MEKYYTPEISDIYIGYECERVKHDFSTHISLFLPEGATIEEYDRAWNDYYNNKGEWEKFVIESPRDFIEHNFKLIRTPYLTKEQIEAEGWSHLGLSEDDKFNNIYEKDKYYLIFRQGTNLIQISDSRNFDYSNTGPSGVIFVGKCPSINEFRKLVKMLGIN